MKSKKWLTKKAPQKVERDSSISEEEKLQLIVWKQPTLVGYKLSFGKTKTNPIFNLDDFCIKKLLKEVIFSLDADFEIMEIDSISLRLLHQFWIEGLKNNARTPVINKLLWRLQNLKNICNHDSFDVTDNKPITELSSTNSNFSICNRTYRINEVLHREDERLKTFENAWPLEWFDKGILAKTGMFYTGEGDKVKCYFCEVEIGRWEETDNPVSEHIKWSSNCPLLKRRTTNNIPICVETLNRILPPQSSDVCGPNDAIEIRPNAYAEGSIVLPATIQSSNNNDHNNSLYYYPEYPEYAIETARLRSFCDWPLTLKQKPTQLSEAGFFYTGSGDRVKCFSCGGGLKDWDDSDDPWEQHALWLSKCRYLKLMKGQIYIDSIISRNNTATATTASSSSSSSTQTEEQATLALQQEQSQENRLFRRNSINISSSSNTNSNPLIQSNEIAIDKKNIPEEKLCKICYVDEYNTAFLPCGHVVACKKCASLVPKCPLCRKPFTDIIRVYFS